MEMMNEKIRNLLDQYGHNNTEYGVGKILERWQTAKANLIEMLSRHPNWDTNNFRIVFRSDYKRFFDSEALEDFGRWMINAYAKKVEEEYKDIKLDGVTVRDFEASLDKSREILAHARIIENLAEESVKVGNFGVSGLEEIVQRLQAKLDKFYEEYEETFAFGEARYVPMEKKRDYNKLRDFRNLMVRDLETNIISEEFEGKFNAIFPQIRCAAGTRIVKVIKRVCKAYGLEEIKDIRETRWIDDNGVEHTRTKDYGYNGQIAKLGDAINPLDIKRFTIISVNPLDYLTMSFGNGWASCHTIDKENIRDNENSYEGMYCSGCLSYMLDSSSLIFYTVRSEYQGNDFEEEDKINRVVFSFNRDFTTLVEGRVYPDGRDGGDKSLASQFREVMQMVICTCTGENNLWVTKKGTGDICNHVLTRGTHYPDYRHYDDCAISYLKGKYNDDIDKYPKTEIGHNPICPDCGKEHHQEGWLCCPSCQSDYDHICERCNEGFNDDYDTIRCEDTGYYYCCPECANNDGVYYCEDDDLWHDEYNAYYDSYRDCYYHEPEVETEDGNYFGTTDNAEYAGYSQTSDGCWYPSNEIAYDENRDTYFHKDGNEVEINGEYYEDEDSAREAGYLEYNGDWYKEEDMLPDGLTGEMFPSDLDGMVVTVDDTYFISKENAIQAGYILNIQGEWTKEAN